MIPTRRPRLLATLLLFGLAPAATLGLGSAVAWARTSQEASTTTTTAVPTTTTAPTTTSTSTPPTTTSTAPSTTTSTTSHTTSSGVTTTSTTRPETTTSSQVTAASSSTPWGWIILALALVAAALIVSLLIARSRRQGREAEWERTLARPAVAAAELARELVLSQNEQDDAQRRASVSSQVDDATAALERAAAAAPGDEERVTCTRCAESLRGLAFAVEADHLMRSGGQHPTGEQLASADSARRQRTAEFDAALQQLKARVAPPSPGTDRSGA